MKTLLLLTILLALSCAAQAQTGQIWAYTGDKSYGGTLAEGQSAPWIGYTVWGTPVWPNYIPFSDTQAWRWTSTCAAGGSYSEVNSQQGPVIGVGASIINPIDSTVQGRFSGYEDVEWIGIGWLPMWHQGLNQGLPCGTNGNGARDVSSQETIE